MRISSAIFLGIAILIAAGAVWGAYAFGKDDVPKQVEGSIIALCDTVYIKKVVRDTVFIEKEAPIRIVYQKAPPAAYSTPQKRIETNELKVDQETFFYSNEEIKLEDIPLVQK